MAVNMVIFCAIAGVSMLNLLVLIDLQEFSVTLEGKNIILAVSQKYFKSSVFQCLDLFVSKLNLY